MPRGNSSRRNMDQPPDREMESLLQEHFDDEGPNLRSPKDPWEWLQSRMEEPDRPSLLSRLLNGLGGMREWRPGTAFAAAGAAAVVLVAAVIIWSVAGDGGPGDDPGGLVAVWGLRRLPPQHPLPLQPWRLRQHLPWLQSRLPPKPPPLHRPQQPQGQQRPPPWLP